MKENRIIKTAENDVFSVINININRANRFVIIILFTIFLIGFMIPVIALIMFTEMIKPGFIISIIIFWGISYYFLKLLLWNLYGKEIFRFSKDNIEYYCDYKYFTANRVRINGIDSSFQVKDIYMNEYNILNLKKLETSDDKYTLHIKKEGNDFNSAIKLNSKEILEFYDLIPEYYKK